MKKIVLGFGVVAFVAAVVVGTTGAFFTDSETTGDNRFQAGTLSIDIDQSSQGSLPIIVDNWAPGETATVRFDVENTGTLPLNLRTSYNGSWNFAGDPGYFKVTKIERFNESNSTWATLAQSTNGIGTGSQVYVSPTGAEASLYSVSPGEIVRLRQVVLFDSQAGNEFQGRTYTANITVDAKQVNEGATWPDSSHVAIGCSANEEVRIIAGEGKIIVTWPTSTNGNRVLESASSITGPWSPVGVTPSIVENCYVVSQTNNSASGFFRLSPIDSEAARITISSPANGETVVQGGKLNLKWQTTNIDSNDKVTLQLKNEKTGSYTSIATAIGNSGSYSWSVPSGLEVGQYRVAINNCHSFNSNPSECTSVEGATFEVKKKDDVVSGTPSISITSPAANSSITVGNTVNINWNSNNMPSGDLIAIQLRNVTSGSFTSIFTAISNDGSESWVVPTNTTPGTYKFTVNNCISSNSSTCVSSEGPEFKIISKTTDPVGDKTLSFLFPSSDVSYTQGEYTVIRWTSENIGLDEKISINLKKSDGSYVNLLTGVRNGVGKIGWTVPSDFGAGKYQLIINNCSSANTGSGCVSVSGPNVTIKESKSSTLSLTNPFQGNTFQKGKSLTISWQTENQPADGKVNIFLKNASTGEMQEIIVGYRMSNHGLTFGIPVSFKSGQYTAIIGWDCDSLGTTCYSRAESGVFNITN
ncbi:MAG: hypothetical protein COV70_01695 [Parcubacteria group bacterium CG11_big_fil_rev_8_21_14_0_20_39_22]|nr:MAG: hypothetical protein COV70_01695 [Parcubacteria group bacterium CG11_big_fil_rev_8_21_14_0_20_39_22]